MAKSGSPKYRGYRPARITKPNLPGQISQPRVLATALSIVLSEYGFVPCCCNPVAAKLQPC
jgi:hypothetical protein